MATKFYQLAQIVLSRTDQWNVHTERFLRESNLCSSVLNLTSSSGHTRSYMFYGFEMHYLEQVNRNLLFFNPLERKIILKIFEYLDAEFGFNHLVGNVNDSKMMSAKVSFLVMLRTLID